MNIAVGKNGKRYKIVTDTRGSCLGCCFRTSKTDCSDCVKTFTKVFGIVNNDDTLGSCMALAIKFFGYKDTKSLCFHFEVDTDNPIINKWENILRR